MSFARHARRRAKANGRFEAGTLAFWFRRKFNLPPNDPRFLTMTPEAIDAEWWAHHFAERPHDVIEDEDEDFDSAAVLAAIEAGEWEDI